MTFAEALLWRILRRRGIGEKFRRQVPIGRYVVDFLCVSAKLVIELDGPGHDDAEQRAHDFARDKWLSARGWKVLRFSNELVIGESAALYNEIAEAITAARRSNANTVES